MENYEKSLKVYIKVDKNNTNLFQKTNLNEKSGKFWIEKKI